MFPAQGNKHLANLLLFAITHVRKTMLKISKTKISNKKMIAEGKLATDEICPIISALTAFRYFLKTLGQCFSRFWKPSSWWRLLGEHCPVGKKKLKQTTTAWKLLT